MNKIVLFILATILINVVQSKNFLNSAPKRTKMSSKKLMECLGKDSFCYLVVSTCPESKKKGNKAVFVTGKGSLAKESGIAYFSCQHAVKKCFSKKINAKKVTQKRQLTKKLPKKIISHSLGAFMQCFETMSKCEDSVAMVCQAYDTNSLKLGEGCLERAKIGAECFDTLKICTAQKDLTNFNNIEISL